MRRLSFLFAGGLLWLFLAAIPALADGGPHLVQINSGTASLTADSCAGCHRAHTAQGEYLLKASSEEALCLSCHGTGGTGATTNVELGIQYIPAAGGVRPNVADARNISDLTVGGVFTTTEAHGFIVGQTVTFAGTITGYPAGPYIIATTPLATTFTVTGGTPGTAQSWLSAWPTATGAETGVVLGALRDGGFLQARIASGAPSRKSYQRGWDDAPFNTIKAISERPKVGVLGAGAAVTSAHIDIVDPTNVTNGLADQKTAWGKGVSGNGVADVTMGCVECHNPHGNGNYRILRPVPGIESSPLGSSIPINVKATNATINTIVTDGQHGFVVGDKVWFAGSGLPSGGLVAGPATKYTIISIVNGFTFKVGTTNNLALPTELTLTTTSPAAGTVTVVRDSVSVADVNVDPDNNPANGIENPTKNYTVLQVKGSQGVDSTYLLYARDVLAARNGTGIAAPQASVSISGVGTYQTASDPKYSNWFVTSTPHGLAVGDAVTLTGTITYTDASTLNLNGLTYYVSSVSPQASLGTAGVVYLDRFTFKGVSTAKSFASISSGSVVKQGVAGVYTVTGGDYFHRSVPWNPENLNALCVQTGTSVDSTYCATANDAPNGRPNAIVAGPTALNGQQAFNDQISTWCSSCHTRYYSSTNERSGTLEPSSDIAANPVIAIASADAYDSSKPANRFQGFIYPATSTAYPTPGYGDQVTFSGFTGGNLGLNSGTYLVVAATSSWFQVTPLASGLSGAPVTLSDDSSGAAKVTRTVQYSASSWWYPRANSANPTGDPVYKYQHQTSTNRACTTCHVAHGSNAVMTGQNGTTFSLQDPYPGGSYTGLTVSTSSRLLKIDNRGTCQACHDPTGTMVAGQLLPNPGGSTTVP